MNDRQSPPNLTIVEAPAAEPQSAPEAAQLAASAETAAATETPRAARPRTWLAWLLFAATVLFAWQWLSTLQRAEGAEARVVMLEGELSVAQGEITAWEGHMSSVRSAVQAVSVGIAEQLGTLQALVDEAPVAPLPAASSEDVLPIEAP